MRTHFYLLIIIITLLSTYASTATINEITTLGQLSINNDLVLNPVSSITYGIDCAQGDTLLGEFRIFSDGDRFPGDQTKYDNWLLGGIDFLILDESNYNLWIESESISPQYEKNNIVEYRWQFSVPSSGTWYLIYINNTIYMKQIESAIIHRSSMSFFFPMVFGMLGLVIILSLRLIQRKKR